MKKVKMVKFITYDGLPLASPGKSKGQPINNKVKKLPAFWRIQEKLPQLDIKLFGIQSMSQYEFDKMRWPK